jgi:hypothetical protein
MSGKEDDYADGKHSYSGKYDDDDRDFKDNYRPQPPKIEILSIEFDPPSGPLSGPLELRIRFELDRDVVAGYWIVRFLVDSSDRRLIKVRRYHNFLQNRNRLLGIIFSVCVFFLTKILGETAVEDYPEGDSEMFFTVDHIDVSGVSPSALANSGLLMAAFVADGEEVASVNMVSMLQHGRIGSAFSTLTNLLWLFFFEQVVNVSKIGERFVREILSPLD